MYVIRVCFVFFVCFNEFLASSSIFVCFVLSHDGNNMDDSIMIQCTFAINQFGTNDDYSNIHEYNIDIMFVIYDYYLQ